MSIAVDGDHPFITGWLACFLGLPRRHPAESALKVGDIAAFRDGWDTCNETGVDVLLIVAFRKMAKLGQVSVYWLDDDGNEIEMRE
jgi:hypothetical protein